MPGADGLAVLDAGCGTGLCAAALRPRAASLTGVDLSPRMLERARGRAIYDALEEAELTTFLLAHPAQFDVIAAADVLVYFGELAELFAAARDALRPHGRFAFTVERYEPAPEGSTLPAQAGYELQPSGRYRHAESYLRATAAASGFAVDELQRVELRLEQNVPVGGFLVLLAAAG
jgi:predicted TPR repeat methyltransferase